MPSRERDFNAESLARRDCSFFRNKRCREMKIRERERFVEPSFSSVKSITTSINVARDCQQFFGKRIPLLHLESFSFRLSILFSFFTPSLSLFLSPLYIDVDSIIGIPRKQGCGDVNGNTCNRLPGHFQPFFHPRSLLSLASMLIIANVYRL